MWTRNYDVIKNLGQLQMEKLQFKDRIFTKDYRGVIYNHYSSNFSYGYDQPKYGYVMGGEWTHSFISNSMDYRMTIEIGGGNSPESYDDYDLNERFTSSQVNKVNPCTIGEVNYVWETGVFEQCVEIDFKNITSEDLIVKEYGVYSHNAMGTCLIYREVLEEPVTIPAGQYYKVRFDYQLGERSINDKMQITDSWDTIINNIENGTASDLYLIGAYRPLLIELEDGSKVEVLMQIVGINHDELSDGSGKATLSWLCKDIKFTKQMHSTNPSNIGWQGSELRTYLNNEFFEKLPDILKSSIKNVNKVSDIYNKGSQLVTTEDKIWLPSIEELGIIIDSSNLLKGQGSPYSCFQTNLDRKKCLYTTSVYNTDYWTRSHCAGNYSEMWAITSDGYETTSYTDWIRPKGIVFGFCI